MLEKNCILYIH